MKALKGEKLGREIILKELREENGELSMKVVNPEFQVHMISYTVTSVHEK